MESWGGRRAGNSNTQLLVEQCSELLGANRSHNYFHLILSTVSHKTHDTAKGALSQIWLADSRVGRTHPFSLPAAAARNRRQTRDAFFVKVAAETQK